LFLKSLPTDCYFNIVGFGSEHAVLFEQGSRKYDSESLRIAMGYTEALDAEMGGTEICDPLSVIYGLKQIDGYQRQVIVLTDGEVGPTFQMLIQLGN
jgi:hypothetical protein